MNPLLPAVIILSLCVFGAALRLNWYGKKYAELWTAFFTLQEEADKFLAKELGQPLTLEYLIELSKRPETTDKQLAKELGDELP